MSVYRVSDESQRLPLSPIAVALSRRRGRPWSQVQGPLRPQHTQAYESLGPQDVPGVAERATSPGASRGTSKDRGWRASELHTGTSQHHTSSGARRPCMWSARGLGTQRMSRAGRQRDGQKHVAFGRTLSRPLYPSAGGGEGALNMRVGQKRGSPQRDLEGPRKGLGKQPARSLHDGAAGTRSGDSDLLEVT